MPALEGSFVLIWGTRKRKESRTEETYSAIPIAVVVVADRFVAKVDPQLATHDFVVVQIPDRRGRRVCCIVDDEKLLDVMTKIEGRKCAP